MEIISDPLQETRPGCGLSQPQTYWTSTAGPAPDHHGPLEHDLEVDVAIIGGGYTGLSTALHLTRDHEIEAVVLEANAPAWGCSGRNGSFVRPAIGRVPHNRWVGRWGLDEAREMFQESLDAVETVRRIIAEGQIDCDQQPDGWLRIAHRPSRVSTLRAEQDLLFHTFGFRTDLLSSADITSMHFNGGEAFGALRWPISFAVHPLKLAFGLQRLAQASRARIYGATPVIRWYREGKTHVLETPRAFVRARRVVFASNGYTLQSLFPDWASRILPVLSNVVVTNPLSEAEMDQGGFKSTAVLSDTRTLLYYYRRLPDNRIMLGGKGPVRVTRKGLAKHREHLLSVIQRKFPFAQNPEADYFWGGWVALTLDSIPHVGSPPDDPSVAYAMGYIGSGVSFSIHAGYRLAEYFATGKLAVPAPVKTPMKRYPLPRFRRLGQGAVMWYHARRDG